MGALVVPLCFLIIWEMTFSLPASTFSASLILFGKSNVLVQWKAERVAMFAFS